jgi:hypothetical protein
MGSPSSASGPTERLMSGKQSIKYLTETKVTTRDKQVCHINSFDTVGLHKFSHLFFKTKFYITLKRRHSGNISIYCVQG